MKSDGIVFLLLALLNYMLDLSTILVIGFTITGICIILSDFKNGKREEKKH